MSNTPLVSTTHLLEGAEVAQLLVEVCDNDRLAAGREHHLHVRRGLGPRGNLVVVTRAGRRRRLGEKSGSDSLRKFCIFRPRSENLSIFVNVKRGKLIKA